MPHDPNTRTASTSWEYRRVKIRRPPAGPAGRPAKPARWYRRAPRNPREPLALTIKFRGGAECWYEVHARGEVGRFPGYVALHDMMREINQTQ